MAKYDANWWFGENSVWQQSGIGDAAADRVRGFDASLEGVKNWVKPSGTEADLLKYGIIGLFAYMVIKK
tara:strand:+ start:128 stop:334 length:207 start_codon:yes stop_codon:yes gene_type:complete